MHAAHRESRARRVLQLAVFGVVVTTVGMGVGVGTAGAAPTVPGLTLGPHGYAVEPNPPVGPNGRLIAARRVPGGDRTLGSARRWQFTYHSTEPGPEPVVRGKGVVSGMVLLPKGNRPPGGWPVVAWAHGTTGLADRCAPSLAPKLGNDASAVLEVQHLLASGFAVVATDYPGLGTPGVHPYLVGAPNGASVIDAVTAAHELLPHSLTRTWVVVGHSEGGQTALFTALDAQSRAPRLDFRGTVALAPASTLEALVPLAAATHDPVDQAYLMYAVVGLGVVDRTVQPAKLFSAAARGRSGLLAHGCIDDITGSLRGRTVDQVLDVDPSESAALAAELGRVADPDRARASAPILVLQGTADDDVPAAATSLLVDRLRAWCDDVDYREYAGLDHAGVVRASRADVVQWIRERFSAAASNAPCPVR